MALKCKRSSDLKSAKLLVPRCADFCEYTVLLAHVNK